jgi:hypothetical protein
LQGQDGDLGWAVQTEGKAYGADAPIDVELHFVELVRTFRVFFAHWWKDDRAQEREPDLAAVGVACEHKVDEVSARMCDDGVRVVRLVGEKDYRGVGLGRDGEVEVGVAGARVFQAAEPEARAVFLNGDVLVDEDGGAAAGERLYNHVGVDGDVMVAEDGVAQGGGECGGDLGAAVRSVPSGDEGERAMGDEVSGEQDHVGGECVDLADDVLEEVRLSVFVEMDVAELYDAVAVEGAGQVRDGDGAVDYLDLVAGDLAGVDGHACGNCAGTDEEVASGKTRRLIGLRTGHSP